MNTQSRLNKAKEREAKLVRKHNQLVNKPMISLDDRCILDETLMKLYQVGRNIGNLQAKLQAKDYTC